MVPVATSISTIRDSVMGIATKSIIEALGGFGNSCDISRYCSCGSGSDDQENRLCKVVVHGCSMYWYWYWYWYIGR